MGKTLSANEALGDRVQMDRGGERRDYLPVVIGVEVEGAKVDVLKIEDGGEIFAGRAIVVEIPVVRSGSIVEVAVSTKGDQMAGIDGFDVLADFIGPGRQDLAAVTFRI